MQSSRVAIAVVVFVALVAGSHAQGFFVALAGEELPLIANSQVNSLVDAPDKVASLPIPGDISSVELRWIAPPGTTYNITVSSSNPTVMPPPVYGVPAAGTVPTTESQFTLSFNCSNDGLTTITTTWGVANAGLGTSMYLTYYFVKRCESVESECAACGTCLLDATCNCDYRPTGSVCEGKVTEKLAETALSAWDHDEFVVATWNTFGVANNGQSAAETLTRFQEIGDLIRDSDFNVVCLQEVFERSARQALVDRLSGRLPHIARQTFGDGPSKDSGLFFASQFPIIEQTFEEYNRNIGADALTDKGIFGALLELKSDTYAYVFNTHIQAGATATSKPIQEAQLRQVKDFIVRRFKDAGNRYSTKEISVLLLGDLNTGYVASEIQNAAGQVSYSEMMTLLQGDDSAPPRDLYGETSPPPLTRNCTSELALETGCAIGVNSVFSRIDYVLAFDVVGGVETKSVDLVSASYQDPQSTRGVGLAKSDGALSDHPIYSARVDVRSDLTALIVGLSVLGVALLIAALLGFLIYTKRLVVHLPAIVSVYTRQARILLRKNWLVGVRNRRAILVQVLVPVVFLSLLFALQFALQNNARLSEAVSVRTSSDAEPVSLIPRCVVGPSDQPCYTFGYTPSGDPVIDALMETVRIDNNIPASEVRSWATPDEADIWMDANRNRTQGVFHIDAKFTMDGGGNRVISAVNYTIQYNNTEFFDRDAGRVQPMDYVVAPMQAALSRAAVNYQFEQNTGRTPDGPGFVLNHMKMPHPELVTVDVVGRNGPAFILGCLMFNFVTQLGQLVAEKELHLRSALRTMGMKSSMYWMTWLVTNMFWNLVSSTIIVLLGLIYQFDFFLKNDARLYIFVFTLFGFAMVPFAFFFSLFISRARTATSFGFGVYLLSIMVQAAAAQMFEEQDTGYVRAIRDVLLFLPFATLAKAMQDLGQASDNDSDTGMKWSERDGYAWFSVQDAFEWLIISFFTFLFLTFFIEFMFSSENGDSRWRRWFCQSWRKAKANPDDLRAAAAAGGDGANADGDGNAVGLDAVIAEAKRVRDGKATDAAMTIEGLRKEYYKFRLCGLRRTDTFVAVHNTWMAVPDKQIFCLLGHNGAGKTTTISMAIGQLNATSGTVKLFGKDMHTDMNFVRQNLGVCPQHDVLWDDLTAAEHITLFAGLKGVPEADLQAEIEKRLEAVALLGEANSRSKTFSGGMKRRLSLAIALTGDPAMVLLDEPTTGMDPVSRREVWTLLESERRKRCIILTTHSMEEADQLGDRIGIMKAGRLRAVGTSLELKHRFGTGFTLTLVTEPKVAPTTTSATGQDEEGGQGAAQDDAAGASGGQRDPSVVVVDVDTSEGASKSPEQLAAEAQQRAQVAADRQRSAKALVARLAPSATMTRSGHSSLEYRVPASSLQELTAVLEAVEEEGDTHGVSDAQTGLTTLEDVFLAVTHDSGHGDDAYPSVGAGAGADAAAGAGAGAGTGNGTGNGTGATDESKADTPVQEREGAQGISSVVKDPVTGAVSTATYRREFNLKAQFRALAAKSFLVQSRRKRTMCFQLLLPVVMVLLLAALQAVVTQTIQDIEGKEYREANLHPPVLPSGFFTPADTFDPENDCPDTLQSPSVDNTAGEWLYAVDSDATVDLPIGAYGPSVPGDQSQFWSASLGYNGPPRSGMLGNLTRDVTRMLTAKGLVYPRRGNLVVVCFERPFTMPLSVKETTSKAALERQIFAEWGVRSRSAGLVFHDLDMSTGLLNVSVVYNQTLTQGLDLPHIQNLVADMVFRQLAPRWPADTDNHPIFSLYGTRDQPIARKLIDFDLISLIGPNIYIFLFQLLFPIILGGLVHEKEFKLREIMKMMGLKTSVYWTVTYLFSLVLYLCATMLFQLIAIWLDFAFFIKNDYGVVFLLTFLYGNTMIAGAFLLSVFFDSSKTAIVFGYCAVFGTGILAASLIAPFFENPDTSAFTLFLLQLVPPFALHRGMLELRNFVIFDGPGITWDDVSDDSVAMSDILWTLFALWIVFMLLAGYCEMVVPSSVGIKEHPLFFLHREWWQRTFGKRTFGNSRMSARDLLASSRQAGASPRSIMSMPPDVAAEREAVLHGPKATDAIRVMDLRVVYKSPDGVMPDKVAVNSLSMGIPIGECFGLLGPNGSGKSSAINCLCGYQTPTSGTAFVAGLNILEDIDLVHLSLGVCPQENVLWEELTGEEHLRFYGRLKDLGGKALDDEVALRLQQVELHNDGHKAAGAYSGGMQRRLCVAIALMGTPAVIALDEPSTGLDPAARRTLWNVIRSCRKHSAVLLTTHSMQEAEELCDRIGIVVNGHMHTIGAPARLKSDVGDFLKLTVMVEDPANVERVESFVRGIVPEATLLIEPLGAIRQYRLPRSSEGARLSNLIRQLDEGWARLGISDWAVTTVSLEEVFLKVTENTRRIGELKKRNMTPAPATDGGVPEPSSSANTAKVANAGAIVDGTGSDHDAVIDFEAAGAQ